MCFDKLLLFGVFSHFFSPMIFYVVLIGVLLFRLEIEFLQFFFWGGGFFDDIASFWSSLLVFLNVNSYRIFFLNLEHFFLFLLLLFIRL